MALETSQKAKEITNALQHGDHIDDMTKNGYLWLQTRHEFLFSTLLQRFTNLAR